MRLEGIKARNLQAAVDGHSQSLVAKYEVVKDSITASAEIRNCLASGYAPRGYGLADFSILLHGGLFHLFHIPRVPGNACNHPANEHWIGHAVSRDLDTWTTRNPVLSTEPAHYFESAHVWAPFVLDGAQETYMFYTGLSLEPSQVLCMARSSDPDLSVWERHTGNPIVPLDGFDWHWLNSEGHVRNARDPHVIKVDGGYLLAYTAMHRNGCPAVGGLFSGDLQEWEDVGPIMYRPMNSAKWPPESVNIQPLPDGRWVLIPSQSPGLEYYVSSDPFSWHGARASSIEYADGEQELPVALEVISRMHENAWLVAFFESRNNRLFIGVLNTTRSPWLLKRFHNKVDLEPWNTLIA